MFRIAPDLCCEAAKYLPIGFLESFKQLFVVRIHSLLLSASVLGIVEQRVAALLVPALIEALLVLLR